MSDFINIGKYSVTRISPKSKIAQKMAASKLLDMLRSVQPQVSSHSSSMATHVAHNVIIYQMTALSDVSGETTPTLFTHKSDQYSDPIRVLDRFMIMKGLPLPTYSFTSNSFGKKSSLECNAIALEFTAKGNAVFRKFSTKTYFKNSIFNLFNLGF